MTAKYNPMTTEGVALLVKKLAWRYERQRSELNLRDMSVDDIEQELWVTWLRCRENFDPNNEAGSGFVNYFVNAARFNMQRVISTTVRETVEIAPASLNDFVSEDGEEFGVDLYAVNDLSPEREFESRELLQQVLEHLSPLVRRIFELRFDPPDDVRAWFAARQAHNEFAVKLGIRQRAAENVGDYTLNDMIEYLGLPRKIIFVVREELDSVRRRFLK